MKKYLSILLGLYVCVLAEAQSNLQPKWVYQQVMIGENCDFVLIHSEGESNIQDARSASLSDLRSKILHTDIVSVNQSFTGKTHETYSSDDNYENIKSKQEDEGWMEIKIDGLPVGIKSRRIDEYFRNKGNGLEYFALVAVPGPNSNIDLSRLATTTSYASDPAMWGLALVPGAAQMYKGSWLKGGLILGGSVALAGGALTCELMRGYNFAEKSSNHSSTSVKQQYYARVNMLKTGMYCCLGGLAALYVYNLIDAIVAPGARRIIVYPAVTDNGSIGLGGSITF